MSDMKTLGSELPKEMAHVRDRVIPAYREIGPARRAKAMAEGDLPAMIAAYEELRGATT